MRDHARSRSRRLLLAVVLIASCLVPSAARAGHSGRGVVIDQTGLPLPGATVQLMRGAEVVTTVVTSPDGTRRTVE